MDSLVKPFSPGDDYEKDWGKTDFFGKTVLDIGADYGSTAWFFLCRGAKKVIAVEGLEELYILLVRNFVTREDVVPILLWISRPEHFEKLIKEWKPDIVKIDIEGAEEHLLDVDNEIFRIPEEYLIEVHLLSILLRLREKLKENGYVFSEQTHSKGVVIVYAKRE